MSQIPTNRSPLGLILYADKTRLLSFGTAEGYPVVMHCANLPSSIRNGNGVGGGRFVGWLPIVKEGPKEKKKCDFVGFKREVWHESFSIIIKSIVEHLKTGCWLECSNGVQRWIFPFVTILSADYEEQTVMALTWGTTSKFPCPVCLVKHEELSNITKIWPHRTSAHSYEIVLQARGLPCPKDSEALLAEYSLCDIDNVFWDLQNTDIHRTLSFNQLHSNNTGLFGRHLWGAFKKVITHCGNNNGCDADGTKFEDISKLFAKLNNIRFLWLLLRAVRSFTIVDLYLSFEEHTEHTIAAGRQELKKFASLMQKYIHESSKLPMEDSESEDNSESKGWNFLKMHALSHSFDDIEAKGATRNYNTKPNEKLHGPLKKSFLWRMNFRDVAMQILRIEHFSFVSALICSFINELENIAREADEGATDNQESLSIDMSLGQPAGPKLQSKVVVDGHLSLHLRQPPVPLLSFGDGFHQIVAGWLPHELDASGIWLSEAIVFSPEYNVHNASGNSNWDSIVSAPAAEQSSSSPEASSVACP
ncbi:hypothetical protein V8E53_004723 [Lactarius tabidus]